MRDPIVVGCFLAFLALVLGILLAEGAGKTPEVHEGHGGGHGEAGHPPAAPHGAHGGHGDPVHGHGH